MSNSLSDVLNQIGEEYKDNICDDSRHYLEISIARKAAELGLNEIKERYSDDYAIVPLKQPIEGMKVRIDGRTFINYAQFNSGVVVPHHIAKQVNLDQRAYVARDSMICNYSSPSAVEDTTRFGSN